MRTLCCDIDGTITTSGLHALGTSNLGARLWELARHSGAAAELIEHAHVEARAQAVLTRAAAEGWRIVFVTAREEEYRAITEEWLRDHAVPYHELHMRPDGVPVPKHKAQRIAAAAPALYLDDDPEVCVETCRLLGRDAPPTACVSGHLWELVPNLLRACGEV